MAVLIDEQRTACGALLQEGLQDGVDRLDVALVEHERLGSQVSILDVHHRLLVRKDTRFLEKPRHGEEGRARDEGEQGQDDRQLRSAAARAQARYLHHAVLEGARCRSTGACAPAGSAAWRAPPERALRGGGGGGAGGGGAAGLEVGASEGAACPRVPTWVGAGAEAPAIAAARAAGAGGAGPAASPGRGAASLRARLRETALVDGLEHHAGEVP